MSFLEHRVSLIALTVSILCARAGPESVFLGGIHRGLGIGAFPDTQNVQNQPVKSFPLSFLEHRVSPITLTVSILYDIANQKNGFLGVVRRGLDGQSVQGVISRRIPCTPSRPPGPLGWRFTVQGVTPKSTPCTSAAVLDVRT